MLTKALSELNFILENWETSGGRSTLGKTCYKKKAYDLLAKVKTEENYKLSSGTLNLTHWLHLMLLY